MSKFIVQGGKKISGTVRVSGSKNAALPILCAAVLSSEPVTLNNVPDIADIRSMIGILEEFGVQIEFTNHRLTIDPRGLKPHQPSDQVIKKMRSSVLMLGALLPRLKELKMAFPGGCVLGKRSVYSHTYALGKLGAQIIEETEYLHLKAEKFRGTKIILPELSVTATENAIMAATLAEGTTQIRLAAAEPHVQDLCHFLNTLGAKITGIGTNYITIEGVSALHGGEYAVTGDYLEAGTLAIAAVATKGDLRIEGIEPNQLDSLWQKFEEMGVKFQIGTDFIHIYPTETLQAVNLKTAVYPGFPTDLQAPFTVLLTQAQGISKVFETLFEGRLNYLFELEMMGARIEYLNPHQALIIGPTKLKNMPISSYDIRAGAAMIIASLIAEGQTEINNINYIDRGYEKFEEKLSALGANILRTT